MGLLYLGVWFGCIVCCGLCFRLAQLGVHGRFIWVWVCFWAWGFPWILSVNLDYWLGGFSCISVVGYLLSLFRFWFALRFVLVDWIL